ncbi:MAG TPA: efflux RND transporter periplasmic adaptor subunit [Thermoanaerobaculia bacterium]|nr:efflux RND transporter periplasmic adaptor subunit [Thermoanaerobaculia bacterium]
MKRKQEAGGRKRVMPAVLAVALLAVACGRPAARSEASATARASGTPTPASGRKVLYWYDPMAPGSKFDKPGKSPFMDMQLVPKYADEEDGSPATGSAAAVTLSPEAIRASGIATVAATRESLSGAIRAVGTIEIDETKQVRVSARVAGRIEKLYAGFTGQAVQAGASLYEIYSPELVATEREYLLSLENRRALSDATSDTVRAADELVTASRDRLRLWGIGPEQIAALERTRKPELALTYRCPITGTVMQKTAVEGQYVTEGTELYLLADLSTVWLMAQVYEYELGRLRIGQTAEVSVSAIPGRILRGRIAFIEPVLDRETRSARVRIALPNPGGILKPGMFADARLETPAAVSLVVPKSALIDTGARRLVYVEVSLNTFAARDVKTGEASGDRVAVVEGLAEGDRVVAAAAFFVDSQAQLSGGAAVQYSGALDVKEKPKEDKP